MARRHDTDEAAPRAPSVRKNCLLPPEIAPSATNPLWLPACGARFLTPTGFFRPAPGRIILISRLPHARHSMTARTFKNTFAPGVEGDSISVEDVIAGLRFGAIKEDSLPTEVHGAVSEELERIERETISTERALVLLLGVAGGAVETSRLQGCAFLVDINMYSKKTRDLFTLFGWKPGRLGQHSKTLERRLRNAVRKGLVEVSPARTTNSEPPAYGLTDGGKEMYRELQETFGEDIALIKKLLAEFKDDRSADRLAAHIHNAYPEYTKKALEQIGVMR
ncbi:MAG: hypothetical protein OXU85_00945 [Thaumarchaeota archaeon]|nr:hypothetical protein [Nitrososphaerota archaeon]